MAMSSAVVEPEPALLPILSCTHLCKTYRMGDVLVRALEDVDFGLAQGELVVLLGASGSGKSTLLNILGGLDTPTSAAIASIISPRSCLAGSSSEWPSPAPSPSDRRCCCVTNRPARSTIARESWC
jgi:ABC-type glutathione transport system ATPase component